ncbi:MULTISPECIES: DUF6843 domain-containing protein [Pontibacillus]|uniref:DUF6843 domain-containing protein n=1 Tax=Pontibacillus chungwhensis TaxID=265426 RepID=A0ABY8V153_9BACI|nr:MULTISPECIES: hypothetical protein [Pontibacillus]MCD5322190.1 hypothetical protein [Pontibacillus sp. HN14]WIF99484.1 hypothetical protein QNI29_07455 [Pontibacillus chungwhensis]
MAPILSFVLYKINHHPSDEVYVLPEEFEGCVGIFYNFENEKSLTEEGNIITYNIPKDGIVKTSSPNDFGWGYEDRSGLRNVTYYYVDDRGDRKEVNEENMIHNKGMAMVETTLPNGNDKSVTFTHFYVGEEDQIPKEKCFQSQEKINEIINK